MNTLPPMPVAPIYSGWTEPGTTMSITILNSEGEIVGQRTIIADMGGTSFDICLVDKGIAMVTTEGQFEGFPVKIPVIDVNTIGAGSDRSTIGGGNNNHIADSSGSATIAGGVGHDIGMDAELEDGRSPGDRCGSRATGTSPSTVLGVTSTAARATS